MRRYGVELDLGKTGTSRNWLHPWWRNRSRGANWGGWDGGALTRDGYLRNAVAYRCVRIWAEAAARLLGEDGEDEGIAALYALQVGRVRPVIYGPGWAERWMRVTVDGRGLFMRGLIEKPGVQQPVCGGLTSLSIRFRPRGWKPLPGGGREVIEVDLVEVSFRVLAARRSSNRRQQ